MAILVVLNLQKKSLKKPFGTLQFSLAISVFSFSLMSAGVQYQYQEQIRSYFSREMEYVFWNDTHRISAIADSLPHHPMSTFLLFLGTFLKKNKGTSFWVPYVRSVHFCIAHLKQEDSRSPSKAKAIRRQNKVYIGYDTQMLHPLCTDIS